MTPERDIPFRILPNDVLPKVYGLLPRGLTVVYSNNSETSNPRSPTVDGVRGSSIFISDLPIHVDSPSVPVPEGPSSDETVVLPRSIS